METKKKGEPIAKKGVFWIKPDCLSDTENGVTDNYISEKPPIQVQDSNGISKGGHGGHGPPVEHPTNYGETLMHLFKGNLGSGLFAMGDAIRNAGIMVGPIVMVFIGLMCTHCMHLLLTASEKMCEKTGATISPDFATTVQLCFENGPRFAQKMAKTMRKIVNVFLCVTQLGFCCVYFVFISSNIQQVSEYFGFYLDMHIHMCFILFPIIMSCLVRNLKYLAPLSTIANILLATGVIITFYFISQDLPPISERDYVGTLNTLPLFFGTAVFAFEGIGLVLPLKSEMKNPKQFNKPFGVLNVGMFFILTLYVALGTISYLQYGDDIEGSVTLNLPKNDLGQSVKIIISVAILLTYALQMYIPVDILWPSVSKSCGPFKHPVFIELCFRTSLVLFTFVLAEAIPYLNLFISLVGALSSTALALIIPPILEFTTSKTTVIMIIKNSIILLIGVVGCFTGTYESISSIVHVFQNQTEATH